MRAVLSAEAVTISAPSGENTALLTGPSWRKTGRTPGCVALRIRIYSCAFTHVGGEPFIDGRGRVRPNPTMRGRTTCRRRLGKLRTRPKRRKRFIRIFLA